MTCLPRPFLTARFTYLRLLVGLLLTALLAGSCKKDDSLQAAQDYSQFTDFDKLDISNGFRLTVRQGSTRQLRIAVPAGDESKLQVAQNNGTLRVTIPNKTSSAQGTIDITMPALTAVRASGGIEGTITGFTQPSLAVELSGGGSLTLAGRVGTLTVDISGGSGLNAYGCPADNAVLTTSGGAEARVEAISALSVTASGGSRVFYKGTPTVSQNLSGGSTLTKE